MAKKTELTENGGKRFEIVLGEVNSILPGRGFTGWHVELLEDRMVCRNEKFTPSEVEILYGNFQQAEFGIGSGNLWLQTIVNGERFVFCTNRRRWKSEAGRELIARINAVTPVQDMKAYERYTGPFWLFFALFG